MNTVSLICQDCMEAVDVPLAEAREFCWCPKCKAPRDAAIAAEKAKREEELHIAKEKFELARKQQEVMAYQRQNAAWRGSQAASSGYGYGGYSSGSGSGHF